MSYLGNKPADSYLQLKTQQITGTGTDTYTLDYPVSSASDLRVIVNNVPQNVNSYTASNTTLTLGGTISASDECWVHFLGRSIGTQAPANNSVTNDMLSGSIATSKLADGSTFATTNGRQVLLSTQNPSGASSVEFINGSGSIDFGSTYKYHIFEFENVSSSSSGDFLLFNGSTNGGTSYSVSKTHVNLQAGVNSGSYFGLTVDTGQSFEDGTGQATLVAGVDTALNTDRLITGTFFAYQSSATSYGKNYKGEFIYDASGTIKAKFQFSFGIMQTTSAITAYKFWMNTGTITGTIRLYGVTV